MSMPKRGLPVTMAGLSTLRSERPMILKSRGSLSFSVSRAGDGSLADYLRSLELLRALADEARLQVLLPGHGPLLADPAGALDYYLARRRERLAEVTAALAAGDRSLAQIVARVYADVDRSLWPFAEWSVRAQLEYLAATGGLPPGVSY